ncbi:uncharacterized protein AMSG_12242 [Thecamonas trahens ATCC 50062]|uniref:Right handed beta helix domain-containing protein n=1 Tax=Thecamonas trahens ATCC 50062 TaxID=461836 RepID=A0A0L0DKZ4_THETB|nr:hypothetical protein AMSG_12242 [Thecamonas trahens ATCC 50062]KNC52987.1 hypothetical protein AMSG_12242 [Thecamonas trahens ATCC 50062]|eukprot:XP_013754920.1 hypothetical protein AMSG_12242 [Thecamonas trahens ATCC 50062]
MDLASASASGDKIAWHEKTDGVGCFGSQQAVSTVAQDAQSVIAADIDGDGDLDLASASSVDNKIAWYENTDGAGSFGPQQVVVSSAANGARSVIAADVDGDGDLDLASAYSNTIAWYENNDGAGSFGPQQVVSTAAQGAASVIAADVDGDGDLDLASASASDHKIAWYENTDGAGAFGPQQVVSTAADGARSVVAADIDGDGDLDLASASVSDNKIAWYENIDGAGAFGPQQVASAAAQGAASVIAADVDGDGDLDLASASSVDNKIAWYENTDGAGSFGPQQVVSTAADGAWSVVAADIDGDGDLDLASASISDNKIAWYENIDGAGSFEPQQVVSTAAYRAQSVIAADIDGDGDLDLASAYSSTIAWYPRRSYFTMSRPATIAASVPGTVVLNATAARVRGGVLFNVQPPPSMLPPATLSLVNITILNMGSGSDSIVAAQGLRVTGSGAVLELENCVIKSSTADTAITRFLVNPGLGGAIAVTNGGTLLARNTTFEHCSASITGGAIVVDFEDSIARISGGALIDNSAATHGGAIAVINGGRLELDGVRFESNVAELGSGGAIYTDASAHVTINDAVVINNVATLGGGVFVSPATSLFVSRATLYHNSARDSGGGIYVSRSGRLTAMSTTLNANSAANFGGGIALRPSDNVTLDDCTLSANTAAIGGAIAILAENHNIDAISSTSHLRVSTVDPHPLAPTAILTNTVLSGNHANRGGGIYACDGLLSIAGPHTVWTRNTATVSGGKDTTSRDAFLCLPAPPFGFLFDRASTSGIPWLSFDSVAFAQLSSAAIATPPAELEAVVTPPATLPVGEPLFGTVALRDAFFNRVTYLDVLVRPSIDTTPNLADPLAEFSSSPLSALNATSELPVISWTVSIPAPSTAFHIEPLSGRTALVPADCDPGTYQATGGICITCSTAEFSTVVNAANCTRCPIRTTSPVGSASLEACTCVVDSYALSHPVSPEIGCVVCPSGAICAGATSLPRPAPGFYSSSSPIEFIACDKSPTEAVRRCLGDDTCVSGRSGRLCSHCAAQHYAVSNGECKVCPAMTGPAPVVITTLILLGVALLLFLILLQRRTASSASMLISAQSYGALTGTEPCHMLRQTLRWARVLWQEISLAMLEIGLLLALALLGLRETFEFVVLGLGLSALITYLVVDRVRAVHTSSASRRRKSALALSVPLDDVAGYALYRSSSSSSSSLSNGGEPDALFEAVVKTLVVHLQTLAALVGVYDQVQWTKSMELVASLVSRATLQVTGLECNGIGFAGEYYLFLFLLPMLLVALVVAAVAVRILLASTGSTSQSAVVASTAQSWRVRALVTATGKYALITFYFFVFPIASKSLAMFACVPENVTRPRASYLASAPWIVCWRERHVQLAVVAACVLAMMAGASIVVAARMRQAIADRGVASTCTFLYAGFTAKAWWFEGVVLGRRLAVAVFASILPRSSVFVGPMLQCVLLAYLLALLLVRPYRSRLALQLEMGAAAMALVSLMLVSSMAETGETASLALMTLMFIAGNGCVVLAGAAALFMPIIQAFRMM